MQPCHPQVPGEGFEEAMQGVAVALHLGVSREDFEHTVAIHPGVAEEVLRLE